MELNQKPGDDGAAQIPDVVGRFVQTYHPSVAAALHWGGRGEDWLEKGLLSGLMRLDRLGCVRLHRDGDSLTVEFLTASKCQCELDKETFYFFKSFKAADAEVLGIDEVSSFAAGFPEAFEKRAGLWRKAVLATPEYQSCYLPKAVDQAKKTTSSSSGVPLVLCVIAVLVFVAQPLGSMGSLTLALMLVLVALGVHKAFRLKDASLAVDPASSPERRAFFEGCETFVSWCRSSEAPGALACMDERDRAALCAMTVALGCPVEAPEERPVPSDEDGAASDERTPAETGGIDWLDVWFAMNALDLAHHMFGGYAGPLHDASPAWPDEAPVGEDMLAGGFSSQDASYESGGFSSADHTQFSGGFSGGDADSGGFGGGLLDGVGRDELSGGFGGGERDAGGFGGGDSSGRGAMFAGGLFGSLFGAGLAIDSASSDDFSTDTSGDDFDGSDGGLFDAFDFGGSDDGGFFDSFDFGDFGD